MVVNLGALYFNLPMPTSTVYAFGANSPVLKHRSSSFKSENILKILYSEYIHRHTVFWLLNEGNACKVEKYSYEKLPSDHPHRLVLVPYHKYHPENVKEFLYLYYMGVQKHYLLFGHPHTVEKESVFTFSG